VRDKKGGESELYRSLYNAYIGISTMQAMLLVINDGDEKAMASGKRRRGSYFGRSPTSTAGQRTKNH
jgi:hypothetical protein